MKRAHSLSEVMHIVEAWFRELFWSFTSWVEAEVVKIKKYPNRIYIELIEYDEFWRVSAKTTWIVWDVSVFNQFENQTGLKWVDVMWKKMLFNVSCSFHNLRWFSLAIKEISSEYILWQLKKQSDDILNRLRKKWILENNKLRKMWFPPLSIALISSKESEWLQDYLSILHQYSSFISYTFFPSIVHWNWAKRSVYSALLKIKEQIDISENQQKSSFFSDLTKTYDAVVIIRWWWWKDWLLWQNDFHLAEMVCLFPCPVVLAIWHTNDTSILDLVSYHVSKTPTDAWYFFASYVDWYINSVEIFWEWIQRLWNQKKKYFSERLDNLYERISLLCMYKLDKVTSHLEFMHSYILSYSVDSMLSKWYTILRKENSDFLLDKDILSLTVGSKAYIETKNFIIDIKICWVDSK